MSRYALCIGINDYPGTSSDLAGCVPDARDFADVLGGRGFETRLLLDAAASKAVLVEALTELVAATGYGDTAFVTYSGHGTWVADVDGDEADRRDEALCPHDIWTAGPLTDDELHTIFAKSVKKSLWKEGTWPLLSSAGSPKCRLRCARARLTVGLSVGTPRHSTSVPRILAASSRR